MSQSYNMVQQPEQMRREARGIGLTFRDWSKILLCNVIRGAKLSLSEKILHIIFVCNSLDREENRKKIGREEREVRRKKKQERRNKRGEGREEREAAEVEAESEKEKQKKRTLQRKRCVEDKTTK